MRPELTGRTLARRTLTWRRVTGRTVTIGVLLAGAAAAVTGLAVRPTRAQDGGGAGPTPPAKVIDNIVTVLVNGKVDDAVSLMAGLKDYPDERDAARNTLLTLQGEQGQPLGHDLVAVQKYSGRMEADDVLVYFEKVPVLMRFTMYEPRANADWQVLALAVLPAGKIGETLHDAPVDYVGQHK